MKVGRLITLLEEFDPDADYVVLFPGLKTNFIVDDVEIDDDGQTVLIKVDKDEY